MYTISKTGTFFKLFFILSLFGILMYLVLAFYTIQSVFTIVNRTQKTKITKNAFDNFDKRYKYILLWTRDDVPFNWTEGNNILINNDCNYKNCYITTNKSLLNDIRNFNAIIFSIQTFKRKWMKYRPLKRTKKQKYVFYSMTSATENPICNVLLDDYFNWTWSYRINSDIVTPFIQVKDLTGKVVAPKQEPYWFDLTTLDTFKDTNITKTKAVMWYSDKCERSMIVFEFIKKLKRALEEHSLELDVFDCDTKKCPNNDCGSDLDKYYYFYLAHESVISEDYVTSEVLKAYNNNAVPIVVGGADYTRFLPPGSYINTQGRSIQKIAANIAYTIRNPNVYYKYFTWKQYFTIEPANAQKGYCDLCELLNKKRSTSRYIKFRKWWYPGPLYERCLPKGAENLDDILSYRKERMPYDKMKVYYGVN